MLANKKSGFAKQIRTILIFYPNKNELELTPGNVKMICDRNAGLGADGVLEGPVIKEDGMHVKVWNPDGSESETSGNGVRIFAKYLKDAGYIQKKNFKLYTLSLIQIRNCRRANK